jgi:hypothetical protein
MTMTAGKPDYQDVLARVRAWAETQENPFDIWEPRWELCRQKTPGAQDDRGNMTNALMTQALRAVNALVADGTLAKTGSGRDAQYMTPRVQQARQAEAGRAGQRMQELRENWWQAKMRLAALGLADTGDSELTIRLDLPGWEALLDLAEAGKAGAR